MDKKLPRIFRNDFNKEINNNRSVYYVKADNDDFSFSTRKETDVQKNLAKKQGIEEKLNAIFKPGRHSFNVDVEIITNEKVYHTKIAGKIRDMIITLDNDVIPIGNILDIKIK